ncbi:MAG: hypothetical protein K6253_02570 [Candidatus Liberibacter asiaticus]|nr:hypothetical protein [Candidatus Liberibacter asiaticus]
MKTREAHLRRQEAFEDRRSKIKLLGKEISSKPIMIFKFRLFVIVRYIFFFFLL